MARPASFFFPAFFLALLLVPGSGAPAWAKGTCSPSSVGAPCSQGGIATLVSQEPGFNLGAANPIHLITGNKYQRELDLPPSPAAPELEIVRHYNALDRRSSVLGQGWQLSYDTRLLHVAGRWQIVQADGSRIMFSASKDDSAGDPASSSKGTLNTGADPKVWTWPNGRKLHFDQRGLLVRMTFNGGAVLDIKRQTGAGPLSGTIAEIVSAGGARLSLGYRLHNQQAYLAHIDSPQGRFQYIYEAAPAQADPGRFSGALRLQRLIRPDGMQRHYLHEPALQAGNPHHITGIEIVSADQKHKARANTWAYDVQGRGVVSINGEPHASTGKVSVQYVRAPESQRNGLTIVTNAQGKPTYFHTAIRGGRYVLLRITGAGCPGCASPGNEADYDDRGRLTTVNGTEIQRFPAGRLEHLKPALSGWPGLQLHYQESGHRTSWSSALTGTERLAYDKLNRPVRRVFSNGDYWQYRYDAAGRPIQMLEKNAHGTQKTALVWQGNLLTQIAHRHENEIRQYDKNNRLRQRAVDRVSAAHGRRLQYTESFDYDDQNRLVRHQLPEGGALLYQWGPQSRLSGIDWHDRRGSVHKILQSSPRQAGYEYANGLQLNVALNKGQARQLTVASAKGAIWTQSHEYDDHGRLQRERHQTPIKNRSEVWRYAYNSDSRLVGAEGKVTEGSAMVRKPDEPSYAHGSHPHASHAGAPHAGAPHAGASHGDAFWYAWQDDGALAALRHNGSTIKANIRRDQTGLPHSAGGYALRYGPDRRLTDVSRDGEPVAAYRHNAFGHRITKQSPQASTDYFYLNNQLVAESQHRKTTGEAATKTSETRKTGGVAPAKMIATSPTARIPVRASDLDITRRYIYAGHVVVGLIDYAADIPQGMLYAVHSDLIGAPRIVTDASQKIRWLAAYSPTGAATKLTGDLTLDLRLPGQVFDEETGWHDNLLRTYLPESGHYLEPDPLGPVPASQALGYANQQPRRYIDPLGLLLFAFDGTRNNARSQSNVWKMSQQYEDGPAFYHTGPGNPSYIDWDAATAYNAPKIIETQWQHLLSQLDQPGKPNEHIPVDIIGFSRGAALARHFGNLINAHVDGGLFSYTDPRRGLISACVDLRFMGLFDTVAQFGIAGIQNSSYDLSISPAWEWVAHAVALHERRWLFPLSSVVNGAGDNTIEAPFIGAHSDIGGGVSYDDAGNASSRGDLSDVALNWMLWQARAASLRFGAGPAAEREVTEPILHDQRSSVVRTVQNGDRRVDAPNGSLLHGYQDDHTRLGRVQRDMTEKLIERKDNWRGEAGAEVGTVNMIGYAQWLQNELGWQPLPA